MAVWVHPTNLFAGAAIAAACLVRWRQAKLPAAVRTGRVGTVVVALLAALLLAGWIWAARPTHGLLGEYVVQRLDDVTQLDRAGNLPSFLVLFARLFSGETIYQYIAGSHSWFEWPAIQNAGGLALDVTVFWGCLLGIGMACVAQ